MHWCPRHTPSTGSFGPIFAMTSLEMPASFGVHGPGEMTTASGFSASISATVISSLRFTTGSAPSSPKYWTRLYVNES